jgi:hypothetical protein
MTKQLKKRVLSVIGIFWISSVLIVSHYYNLTDLSAGLLYGIGISLLVIPLLSNRFSGSTYPK